MRAFSNSAASEKSVCNQDVYAESKVLIDRLRFVSKQDAGYEIDRDDISDVEKLGEIAICLEQCEALSFDDLFCKIQVWRALAPEDQLIPEEASVDGKLLLSILHDVERLGAQPNLAD